MSIGGYITKYVGKYRVLAEYDKATNDWVRDEYGDIADSFEDCYINFADKSGRLENYYDDIFILNIWNIEKGRSIIENVKKDYHTRDLVKKGIVEKILKTSGEILVYVKEDNLSDFLKYIKLETKGKSISPFDNRNLPQPCKVPKREYDEFDELRKKVGVGGCYLWSSITREFIKDKCGCSLADFRKTGLTYESFIYENGLWEKYIKILTKNIPKKV